MSFGIMVTRLAWMAHRLVSSKRPTKLQVGLASLLQGHDGRALEAQIRLEVLGDFTHQALEGQLADEQFGALLVGMTKRQTTAIHRKPPHTTANHHKPPPEFGTTIRRYDRVPLKNG